jgi:hypothetical protein
VRYAVRFNWLPEAITDGYLLVPEGEGRRPAVVAVFMNPRRRRGSAASPIAISRSSLCGAAS